MFTLTSERGKQPVNQPVGGERLRDNENERGKEKGRRGRVNEPAGVE